METKTCDVRTQQVFIFSVNVTRVLFLSVFSVLICANSSSFTSARKVFQVDATENVTLVITNNTFINSTVKTTNNGMPNGNSVPSKVPDYTSKISKFSPYFGVEFSPYVRSDGFPRESYPLEDIKKMLRVILTKSHSVLTYEMGYPDENYRGLYDTTSPSIIATAAAYINAEANNLIIQVSQGTGIRSEHWVTHQSDIEAALNSAQRANSIFPHTVWSITFSPDYTSSSGNGHVIDPASGRVAITEIQKHSRKVHEMNLKVGVWVDLCGDMLEGDKDQPIKRMLLSLANITDFFICSVYPTVAISEPEDYFNSVRSQYEIIKSVWSRVAPHLKIYLQTGWATEGQSNNNPAYLNSSKKSKVFWELMEKWAEDKKQRVFMHEAFDIPEDADAHSGYWKRVDDNSESYMDKGTGQDVKF